MRVSVLPLALKLDEVMRTVWKVVFWLLVAVTFICVLFADFLPLPFGGYASQRFILVGLLALAVVFPLPVLVYRHGWALFRSIWPAIPRSTWCCTLVVDRAPFYLAGQHAGYCFRCGIGRCADWALCIALAASVSTIPGLWRAGLAAALCHHPFGCHG